MGFPRQEYWSGLPFPPPGNLISSGIKPMSPALSGGFFTTKSLGKPQISIEPLPNYQTTKHFVLLTNFPKITLKSEKESQYILQLIYSFHWRIITLQYCGGFCRTSTWISHGCTCVPPSWTPLPPPSPPHPSGLSQSTSFEHPALCIELALVIYFTYGNIHGKASI